MIDFFIDKKIIDMFFLLLVGLLVNKFLHNNKFSELLHKQNFDIINGINVKLISQEIGYTKTQKIAIPNVILTDL